MIELQNTRHIADYDVSRFQSRIETLQLLDKAKVAFSQWQRVRNTEESHVFLCALLFNRQWTR